MNFQTTPTGYEKTILSDLQGAWENFREAVADIGGFKGAGDVLSHTDEAMSWETVRNLKLMPPHLLPDEHLDQMSDQINVLLQHQGQI